MSTQPHNPPELYDPLPVTLVRPDPKVEAMIVKLEGLDLPSEDGIPLETEWHFFCMHLLIDSVMGYMGTRTDYHCGGNEFIYFSAEQVRNRDFRGPDFFFVDQISLTPLRDSWIVWNEGGRYPDAIIELSSPSTADVDRTTKFRIYEQVFQTKNYFIYDPGSKVLDGWELENKRYKPLTPNEHGRLWSSALGLWVGRWRGVHGAFNDTWLRFFDTNGNVVPSPVERADHAKQQAEEQQHRADEQQRWAEEQQHRADEQQHRADEQQHRADEQQHRADEQQHRADEQQHRADEQQHRADAAEQELARLRATLAHKENNGGPPPPADL